MWVMDSLKRGAKFFKVPLFKGDLGGSDHV
jgi:hypothetical protein